MRFGEALRFSVQALRGSPVRSLLTCLGMLIGNASVILVVTISQTSQDYILEQIRGLGSNVALTNDGLENGVGIYIDNVYYGRVGQSQFDLVDLQGLSPAEVAERTGMKPVSVRANLFKARKTIRENLLATHPSYSELSR